jgi:hypothetical protein
MTTLRTLALLFACFLFALAPSPRAATAAPPPNIVGTFDGTITLSNGDQGPFTLTVTRQSRPNSRDRSLIRGTAVAGSIRVRFKGTLTETQLVGRAKSGNVRILINGTVGETGLTANGTLRATQRGQTVAEGTFTASRQGPQ